MRNVSNNDQYEETFFIVPTYILSLPGLNFDRLKVYQTIYQFWNKSRTCFLSNKSISTRTGVHERNVQKSLEYFENINELQRKTIGSKRYLVQPERVVELVEDDFKGGGELTVGGAANPPGGGGKLTVHNIKKLNKENNITKENSNLTNSTTLTTSKTSTKLQICNLEEDNPHKIPIEMLEDWQEIRKAKKAPITRTAWKNLTKELSKCQNPIYAFETMVANGWLTIKSEWLNKAKETKNAKDYPKDGEWAHLMGETF